MRCCSDFDPDHSVVCDLPVGHIGLHQATIVWGDEDEGTDDE